jgi:hypothetical protein
VRMGGRLNWHTIVHSGSLPADLPITFGFCYQSQLISEMDLKETGCENGKWIELAQDRVQWRALVLAVLNLRVLLPESVN